MILPTYYLYHGGGPWPYMKDQLGGSYDQLEHSLINVRREVADAPRAVLMISAHWEAPEFTVSSGPHPGMIYDYFGFPEHTYHIKYEAPGSPELAHCVAARLLDGGIRVDLDGDRGFDHGTFSLMKEIYPEADMPIVQLSLKEGLDPALHIEVGQLLGPLREEGVLIIGSGASYHNLRRLGEQARAPSREFDDWLQDTLTHSTPDERMRRLKHWRTAPSGLEAHPREEHLLPLMTVVGAAEQSAGVCVYHQDDFGGALAVSSFRFGAPPSHCRSSV